MTESRRQQQQQQQQGPKVGDVVLVDDRVVGVIRYIGPLQFDKEINFGVEIKGQPLPDGHDGTLHNIRYFHTTQGHGTFIKNFRRIIPPEELLEKIASLYEIIKHDQRNTNHITTSSITSSTINGRDRDSNYNNSNNNNHKNKENIMARYFVDKSRYDDLLQEYETLQAENENLSEKCENLEMQNQLLRGQSAHKIEDVAKLHEKVNSWANRFGMRRPTLSSLDDSTISEINLLIQHKEQHKTHRSYHSNSHLPNSGNGSAPRDVKQLIGDYEAPVLLSQASANSNNLRNSHSKTREEIRKRDRSSRVMDDTEIPHRTETRATLVLNESDIDAIRRPEGKPGRVARESVEVSSTTVQNQILGKNSHQHTPSETALSNMDREWENKLAYENDHKTINNLYVKPKRKNSLSMTPTSIDDDYDLEEKEEEEEEEEEEVNGISYRARQSIEVGEILNIDTSVVTEMNKDDSSANHRSRESRIMDNVDPKDIDVMTDDQPNNDTNTNINNNNNNNNSTTERVQKHDRTPSEIAIDKMDSQWEQNLGFEGLLGNKSERQGVDNKPKAARTSQKIFSKPHRKDSLSIAKNNENNNNGMTEKALKELIFDEKENSEEEEEEEEDEEVDNSNNNNNNNNNKRSNLEQNNPKSLNNTANQLHFKDESSIDFVHNPDIFGESIYLTKTVPEHDASKRAGSTENDN